MSKKVLFVQGGGIRGAYVYGVLLGISEILNDNCLDIFDDIYSSSASSCTLTYFLSNQAQKEGMKIWTQAVTRKEFINSKKLYRIFQKKTPYLNSYYLSEKIFREADMKINYKELRKRINKLHYTLFDVGNSKNTYMKLNSNFEEGDIHTILNASTAIPILNDTCVEFEDRKYIDGGAEGIDFTTISSNELINCKKLIILSEKLESKRFIIPSLLLKLFSKVGNLSSTNYLNYLKLLHQRSENYLNLLSIKDDDSFMLYPHKKYSIFRLINNSSKNIHQLIQEGKNKAYENEEKIKEFLLK